MISGSMIDDFDWLIDDFSQSCCRSARPILRATVISRARHMQEVVSTQRDAEDTQEDEWKAQSGKVGGRRFHRKLRGLPAVNVGQSGEQIRSQAQPYCIRPVGRLHSALRRTRKTAD